MIKTIIFDFGDVFINLDKEAPIRSLLKLGVSQFSEEMTATNSKYEVGRISSLSFVQWYKNLIPNASETTLIEAWNSIILDFPEHRLRFIEELAQSKKFQLILLSNTNALHIEKVKENMSQDRFDRFKKCFHTFYLSHEIHLRKPHPEIFEFVLEAHGLTPNECLFIDDSKENTDTAKRLGLHVWNNHPKKDDVTELFSKMKHLF